jgi:hypothetical protein
LEGDRPAGPHSGGDRAQRLRRVVEVHEDEPADGRVELVGRRAHADITLHEAHVAQTDAGGASTRGGERRAVDVDSDDDAVRTDELGDQERHVAGATADVEDPHARRQTGSGQEPFGHAPQEHRLVRQALVLVV